MKKKRLFALLTIGIMFFSVFSTYSVDATEKQDTNQQVEVLEEQVHINDHKDCIHEDHEQKQTNGVVKQETDLEEIPMTNSIEEKSTKEVELEESEPQLTSHIHSWAYTYLNDEEHIKYCVGWLCGAQEYLPHTPELYSYEEDKLDGGHYTFCEQCNHQLPTEPHKIEVIGYENSHHIYCTICSYSENYEPHVPENSNWRNDPISDCHTNVCKVCDRRMEEPHNLTYWSEIQDKHRFECDDCTYYGTEDCTDNGIILGEDPDRHSHCKYCKALMFLPCLHSVYSMNSTANEHYKYCNICKSTFDRGSHIFEYVAEGQDNHKEICSVCQYGKDTKPHTWKYVNNGSSNHRQVCTLCHYENGTQPHSFSYEADGNNGHYKYCDICNRRESTTDHSYSGDTCTVCGYVKINCRHIQADIFNINDPINHLVVCNDCNQNVHEPHSFDGYNSCIKCGYHDGDGY